MRTVYVDEAGISNDEQEPILVITGAMIDPDQNWRSVADYLDNLAHDLFPDEYDHPIFFRAKDIWHGSGKFSRVEWSRADRTKILTRLAQIPELFQVPICLGMIDKGEFREHDAKNRDGDASALQLRQLGYATAYHMMLQSVDWWMRKNRPDEVAVVIAEDTQEIKPTTRLFHSGAQIYAPDLNEEAFTTTHIVDDISFATKATSPLLQVADLCAFLNRRTVAGCKDAAKIFRPIRPWVVVPSERKRGVIIQVHESELKLVDRGGS